MHPKNRKQEPAGIGGIRYETELNMKNSKAESNWIFSFYVSFFVHSIFNLYIVEFSVRNASIAMRNIVVTH